MPPLRNKSRISLTTSRLSKTKSSINRSDFKFSRRPSTRQSASRPKKTNVGKTLKLFKSLAFQMAIAELEDKESSTESEEEEEEEPDTMKMGEEEVEEEEKQNDLVETLEAVLAEHEEDEGWYQIEHYSLGVQKSIYQINLNTDDTSSSEDDYEYEYVKQNDLNEGEDFLETFKAAPKVDEISLDLIDVLKVKQPTVLKKQTATSEDIGKFVHPLTGLPIRDSNDSLTFMFNDLEDEIKEADIEMELPQNSSDDTSEEFVKKDFEELTDEFKDERDSATLEDTALHLFFTTAEKEVQFDVKSAAAYLSEQQMLDDQRVVREFIFKLIDRCVNKAEYSDEEAVLRISLDKRKLMTKINSQYAALEVERNISSFLNHKTAEHFKRKKSFRWITPDDPTTLPFYRKRFGEALSDLDKNLIREKKAKIICSDRTSELRSQFEETQQKADKEVAFLEQMMMRTFQSKNFQNFETCIRKSLNRMSTVRNEISEVRLRLLLKQHQYSALKKQIEKLEDLGNGLNIHHFESLETETTDMSKKVEEQNLALKGLHIKCNANIHQISHTREKQGMMKNIISAQKAYLEELLKQKKDLRQYVTQLRLKHNSVHYKLYNLMYQSGVLFKPELMEDYDKTAQKANKLRQTNDDLRRKIEEINTKIAILEGTCMV